MRDQDKNLVPSFSSFFPSLFDHKMQWMESFHENTGVSLSEDEKHIYVEAAVPGICPEEIEMTFDKGMLMIKAEKKEETSDKNKKFYKKAYQKFFYHVAVPGNFDETKPPEAICKDGMLKVSFAKSHPDRGQKKIPIKKG